MDGLWLLVLLALACTIVFPPLGFLVGAGGALYAHRVAGFSLRNVLLAFFVVLLQVRRALEHAEPVVGERIHLRFSRGLPRNRL